MSSQQKHQRMRHVKFSFILSVKTAFTMYRHSIKTTHYKYFSITEFVYFQYYLNASICVI